MSTSTRKPLSEVTGYELVPGHCPAAHAVYVTVRNPGGTSWGRRETADVRCGLLEVAARYAAEGYAGVLDVARQRNWTRLADRHVADALCVALDQARDEGLID